MSANVTPALKVEGLTKKYGNKTVLTAISFTIQAGECVALLGPNGAGKTTLLRCLGGILRPDTGKISVFGYDMYHDELVARTMITYVPDTPHFFPELTVWEHLKFVALAHGYGDGFDNRAEALLQTYGLPERTALPFELSRGMAQKLSLCCALIRPWQLMLLDEPTANLDHQAFDVLKETILAGKEAGKAFLLSTHQLPLAAEVCDHYLLVIQGRLLFTGDLAALKEASGLVGVTDLAAVYEALLAKVATR
ncbi:ABC-type transporter ATP-binding protein EcsA [Moorella thermoacetica]|uniref:ABC-type transporter ATP-binding protein EcsA n=1 Tax=Neomoorella thermoacetica TaxID=1525 RepID=A0A1J5JDW1_NEOTH|nr:ABC transporter ATP-binding protein [Moorella thermoacetica]OIQ07714.1 ABC-type transporter ATP-binding protein EcsA [Moorella thermoacetica]